MDTERKNRMRKLFTSESVTEGHPDKVCDQISDAILDEMLRQDPAARVACECCATTGLVMIMGEITANGECNMEKIARQVIRDIGYNDPALGFDADSCAVITAVHGQSPDISQGVTATADHEQGAGDQGMMFGFACNETEEMTPMALALSQRLTRRMAQVRKEGKLPWMRPDGKAQVTVAYEDGVPVAVDAVVISTQHDETVSQQEIARAMREEVIDQVIPARLLHKDTRYYINPTGRFVLGGPAGDSGLTGRKIIVDTYGGYCPHGGGAFSGKDPSKVDRSAAYAARHIAKNAVAAGIAEEMLVQISYAIGKAEPVNFFVNTYGTSKVKESDVEIAEKLLNLFPLTPFAIEERLKLRQPIYTETAAYGHMGRTPKVVTKHFASKYEHKEFDLEVELFTWEKLDQVEAIKAAFKL